MTGCVLFESDIFAVPKRKADRPSPCTSACSESKKPTPTRKQCYQAVYSKDRPFISASDLGIHYAYCSVCSASFSVAHGGAFDVKRHWDRAKHVENRNAQMQKEKMKSIHAHFGETSSFRSVDEAESVTRAEAMFSLFLAEHHIPMAVADHFSKLVKKTFCFH